MEDGLATAAIDAVIVPGVTFDAACCRLGQGKGFYETTTPSCTSSCRRRAPRMAPRAPRHESR